MKVRSAISRVRTKDGVTTRVYIERLTLSGWEVLYSNRYPIWFSRFADADEWIRLYKAIKRR